MRRLTFVGFLALIISGPIFAFPYQPPAGGEEITSLFSPLFLAGGTSVTSPASPEADAINPAASALAQRAVFDLSYVGLASVESPASYSGTGVNLGLTYPTNYGVFSGSGHFLGSGAGMDLGSLGSFRFSFAKDLFPNLLVGAGLGLTLGAGPTTGAFDWGLGLDLGFISMPGNIGILKNFAWGVAFDNIGKGYAPASVTAPYPPPFTPIGGVSFTLLQSKYVDVAFNSDLSFPAFSDAVFDLGSTITIADFASLRLSTSVSATSLFGANPGRYFPLSGGITLNFKTTLPSNLKYLADKGWTRSEINPTVSVTPLENHVIAFGGGVNMPLGLIDTTPPAITTTYSQPAWISPNNDGVQDFVDVPVRITDDKFVYGYKFLVYDDKGQLVREIDNPDFRPESQGVQNIVDRLLYVKSGIPIPPSFRWDGKDNIGQVVPDGTYSFAVSAFDENGNAETTPKQTVTVKDTPPQLTLKPITGDDLVFSPGGEGLKSTIEITQGGSSENEWSGKFVDSSGKTVRAFDWKSAAPQSFLWDGKDDSGMPAPDGAYTYVVSATDAAGNTTSGSIPNIFVNTIATPVELAISPSAFSPGSASPIQTVTFTLGVPVRAGIVSWSLQVVDSHGTSVRNIKGTSDLPTVYVYDGKDDNGSYLKEGSYHGVLGVLYRNGHNPQATSPAILVDLTPPSASIATDFQVFSPTGDSPRPQMIFHATASQESSWSGEVDTADGTPVRSYHWVGQPDSTVMWDGRGDDGRLEPDGGYKFLVKAVDEAGNAGKSNAVSFTLDTEQKQLFINSDFDAFSPNGARNAVHLLAQLKATNGLLSYTFDIVDKNGNVQIERTGTTPPAAPFTWDGKKQDGTAAADGLYRGQITASYSNGTSPKAVSGWFALTTKLPAVQSAVDFKLFSPGGGARKTVTITQSSSTTTTVWKGQVLRSDGQVVKEWNWPGSVETVVWDGTDAYGNTVHDGTYKYVVTTTDEAGNFAQAAIDGIVVDNRPTQAFVTVDQTGFSPNGDGIADVATYHPFVTLADGLAKWDLAMVLGNGTVIKDFVGGSNPPPSAITWDGKGDSGQVVEGTYTARFTAVYAKGDVDVATTRSFVLDVTPPGVTVKLSPIPFAPDNSGPANNVLNISLDVRSPADIDRWSFQISDPTNKPFYTFAGVGAPGSSLFWNGLSTGGELVQSASDYPYTLTVRDVLGNTRVVNGTITTGILVMKEGDQYLIRISSINFAPFSSALVTASDDPVLAAKNAQVLDLIAQTLKRYSTYKIRLEGNAVSVYWQDPARAAKEQTDTLIPLSLARAESVKQALIALGIPVERMTTVGLGGANPVVPFSDAQNLWKDRRVDFVLLKD